MVKHMNEAAKEQLTKLFSDFTATVGICLPDDATAEDILAAARQTAREWNNTNMSLNTCLDMVSRYFFVPGKATKEMIQEVIREEFGV